MREEALERGNSGTFGAGFAGLPDGTGVVELESDMVSLLKTGLLCSRSARDNQVDHRLDSSSKEQVSRCLNGCDRNGTRMENRRKSLKRKLVGVAQLVRASDCGSESRGFESRHPPYK